MSKFYEALSGVFFGLAALSCAFCTKEIALLMIALTCLSAVGMVVFDK